MCLETTKTLSWRMAANENRAIFVEALTEAGMGFRSKGRFLDGPQQFFLQLSEGIMRILAHQALHIH
jgi:hypothetical protein